MEDLRLNCITIESTIDADGEIWADCGHITKSDAIQIIDHLTKVFDIKPDDKS